jgi:transposase
MQLAKTSNRRSLRTRRSPDVAVPQGHWKTITLVAGLRDDGMVAPLVIDGAMNGPRFLAYVEQCLAPTLHRGDIVIMDNLKAHKVAGVMEAIEAVGATGFYLPAYSPDLNPIELVFSKIKALLRKENEPFHVLWRRIRSLLASIGEPECINFFRHGVQFCTDVTRDPVPSRD